MKRWHAILVALVLTTSCRASPSAGPLGDHPYATTVGGFHGVSPGKPFTFGQVFIMRPTVGAVLERATLVEPTDGLTVVGQYVIDMRDDGGRPAADNTFPPKAPVNLIPLDGFRIEPGRSVQVVLALVVSEVREGTSKRRA